MNDLTARRIDKLLKSARNAARATNPAQRDAAQAFLVARAGELRARRDEMLARIEAGWTWLDQFPPHDPAVAKEEERFGAWNVELRAIADALDEAASIWTGVGGSDAA